MRKKMLAFVLAFAMGLLLLVNPVMACEGPNGEMEELPYDYPVYTEKGSDGEIYMYWKHENGEVELCRNHWNSMYFGGHLMYADEEGKILRNCWKYLMASDGSEEGWCYFDEEGLCQVNKWVNWNESWYHCTGCMDTGWLVLNMQWYYLGDDGAMRTGWQYIGNDWYYFYPDGKMAIRWLEDNGKWYYFRPWNHEEFDGKNAHDGRMQTGWIKDNGKWYYLNPDGAMVTGWLLDNGKWYYLNSNGSMATGWVLDAGKWYYLNKDGSMATGWVLDNGKWYYLKSDGSMACKETLRIDGKKYSFDQLGVWYK